MSLTAPINIPERAGAVVSLPVAAATLIYAGSLVAEDASGNLVPATDTAALRIKGRAEVTVDNTLGAAGALSLQVKRGVFKYANSTTHALAAADVGKSCYVEAEDTVASTSTNKILAGRVVNVASDGVWVDTSPRAIATALVAAVGSAVATTGSTVTTPYGYSQAQADALVAMVNQLRVAVLELQTAINA